MIIDTQLWQAYAKVTFAFKAPYHRRSFAIVTAWNPKSQWLSVSENNVNNQRLLQHLQNYAWCEVVVGNMDANWFEDSFAVDMPLDAAMQLAAEFGQNAIYYVIDDALSLHSCVDEQVLALGRLQDKLS